jgi:hypothetical protein
MNARQDWHWRLAGCRSVSYVAPAVSSAVNCLQLGAGETFHVFVSPDSLVELSTSVYSFFLSHFYFYFFACNNDP